MEVGGGRLREKEFEENWLVDGGLVIKDFRIKLYEKGIRYCWLFMCVRNVW